MNKKPIALQMWPVREEFGEDMPGTLKAIAKIGYDGVELCRWFASELFDKWDVADIRKAGEDVGLDMIGSHIPYENIYGDALEELIEFGHIVGMKYATVGSLPKEMLQARASVLEAAERFNAAAERMKPEGMFIGFHSHGPDFQPLDGETPWDILFSNTEPEVVMQLDIGNTLGGGADPCLYLERCPGRARTVHVKDRSAAGKKALAVGDGDIDWSKVFDLCERLHDPEWYVVEQACAAYTPMECAEISLRNLREMGR